MWWKVLVGLVLLLLIHNVAHQLSVHLMRLHKSVPELLGYRVVPSLVLFYGCRHLLSRLATLPNWERRFLLQDESGETLVWLNHDFIIVAPRIGLCLNL